MIGRKSQKGDLRSYTGTHSNREAAPKEAMLFSPVSVGNLEINNPSYWIIPEI
jgi:hypothetical protein